jgi:hypothetical protein
MKGATSRSERNPSVCRQTEQSQGRRSVGAPAHFAFRRRALSAGVSCQYFGDGATSLHTGPGSVRLRRPAGPGGPRPRDAGAWPRLPPIGAAAVEGDHGHRWGRPIRSTVSSSSPFLHESPRSRKNDASAGPDGCSKSAPLHTTRYSLLAASVAAEPRQGTGPPPTSVTETASRTAAGSAAGLAG